MPTKRSADGVEAVVPPPRREQAKRAKLSPSAEERSNSSVPSSCSVSEASALQSSPPASTHERNTSMSSLESAESDDESESSVPSDSDSDSPDDDVVTIGAPKKPDISRIAPADGPEDLRSRLAALLPQLEEANSLLASEGGQYSMEDVEEGGQYIEMNLGLGVLEEKGDESDSSSESEIDSVDEDDRQPDEELDLPVSSGALKRSPKDAETRRVEKLTGGKRDGKQTRTGIEEIG